jgi:hypothetical protein
MTRRSLLAALLAPLIAKFARKPAQSMAHAWKEGGHTFYGMDFGKENSFPVFVMYVLSPLDKKALITAGWGESSLTGGDNVTISEELLHSIGFRRSVGPGCLNDGVLYFTEVHPILMRAKHWTEYPRGDAEKELAFLSGKSWAECWPDVPMARPVQVIDRLSPLIQGAGTPVQHKTA